MVAYIKLESKERTAIKREVFGAEDSILIFRDSGEKIAKLKRKKKNVMKVLTTSMKEINNEIVKIKELFPQIGSEPKKPVSKEITKQILTRIIKKRPKTNYEEELKKIKQRLANL